MNYILPNNLPKHSNIIGCVLCDPEISGHIHNIKYSIYFSSHLSSKLVRKKKIYFQNLNFLHNSQLEFLQFLQNPYKIHLPVTYRRRDCSRDAAVFFFFIDFWWNHLKFLRKPHRRFLQKFHQWLLNGFQRLLVGFLQCFLKRYIQKMLSGFLQECLLGFIMIHFLCPFPQGIWSQPIIYLAVLFVWDCDCDLFM